MKEKSINAIVYVNCVSIYEMKGYNWGEINKLYEKKTQILNNDNVENDR